MTTIQVYATSDMHGQLVLPFLTDQESARAGIAYVAELFAGINPETSLRIDNGDTFVGSRLATWQLFESAGRDTAESVVTEFIKSCGYDAFIPGNHDFDYGVGTLARLAQAAAVPLLLANVTVHGIDDPFLPYKTFERSGVKIGVIGLISGAMQQLMDYRNMQDVTFQDPVETLQTLVPEIRDQVDVLIVSYHGGIERDLSDNSPTQYDTGEDEAWKVLSSITGIDGLITGHQHRRLAGEYGDTIYLQPGYGAETVGKMQFTLTDRKITEQSVELIDIAALKQSGQLTLPGTVSDRLGKIQQDFDTWLAEDSTLSTNEIHDYLRQRVGASASVLLSAAAIQTWADLANCFTPPYQVSVYHMPKNEYDTLMRNLTAQGIVVDAQGMSERDAHVRFVMNGSTFGIGRSRVSVNPVMNIFDELVALAERKTVHQDLGHRA